MTRSCIVCGTLTKKTCTGCANTAYCSRACQTGDWLSHIVDCESPGRELTTADHLAASIFKHDTHYMKGDTAKDYGYFRIQSAQEGTILDSIWVEVIFAAGVKPPTLHKWRIEGRLHQEVVALYRTTANLSPVNLAWLLDHPTIFDPDPNTSHITDAAQDMKLVVWRFIGGPPTDTLDDLDRKADDWPLYKQCCFHFYVMVMAYGGPLAALPVPWVVFGYCVFNSPVDMPLRQLYRDLIDKCTFEEFCEAYRASRLVQLMDSKGFRSRRIQMPEHFETVLSQSPNYVSTVWYLRTYLIDQSDELPDPMILLPYGFANCRDRAEFARLIHFYAKVLRDWAIPPLALHDAAVHDGIYEYVSRLPIFESTTPERRFLKRVLKTQNWWLFGGSSSTATQWIELSAFVYLMILYHARNRT
ncbi:hypothetical protein SISNIDRAFT_447625 [Sistotremastrum niveocremeum HHB9708]|uniref:MYND-type domain-containing protein n=1 Tax=Sistotremastrum niveocremeum HHB9708 TaxID=1314777 RepID=A0A165AD05_9AGAM|nr:hypothetical protein SISNIDRAFT_447625 [Sistotremastrum niveocremeum HHB9708]